MPTPTADDLQAGAQRAIDAKDWITAMAFIAEGLAIAPAQMGLLKLRLTAYLRQGRWRKAFQAFDALLRQHPHAGTLHDFTATLPAPFLIHGERMGLYLGCFAVSAIGFGAAWFARSGVTGAVAAVAILTGAVLGIEVGYRIRLYAKSGIRGERYAYPENLSPPPFFVVSDRATQTYHPVRGYDLVPNNHFVRIGILDGKVVEAHTGVSDSNGNSGFTDVDSDDAQVNILILGDSYTSLPGNGCPGNDQEGVEWPYFFKQSLAAAGITNIQVLNYARSGHGILQMADTAVSVLERHKPDIVVFAFNTLDLTRHRYWHKTIPVGGALRCFRAQAADASLDHWAEESIIDERVTLDWARERMARGDTDALLHDICRRQRALRRRSSARAVDLFSPQRLYAWDWLFFGTPFIDVDSRRSPRIVWWKMQDSAYDGDSQFTSAIQKIRRSGAGIVLAHLPRKEDLIANDMLFQTRNECELLASLHRLTGEQIYAIGSLYKLDPALVERKYPRYPHDAHPSVWAQKLLGQGLAQYFAGPLAPGLKKRAPQ